MKFRVRLILLFLTISIIPLVIAGVIITRTTNKIYNLASSDNLALTNRMGEVEIQDLATAIAREIGQYLVLHTYTNSTDFRTITSDPDLKFISVQPVGKTGYTMVFDSKGLIYFHQDREKIGVNLSDLYNELPVFWNLISTSFGGLPTNGYYDWEDPNGKVGKKYIAILPVENSNLRVAATAFISEFTFSTQGTSNNLANSRKGINLSYLFTFGLTTLFIAAAIIVLSGIIASPIEWMASSAYQFIKGLPEKTLPVSTVTKRSDEIGFINNTLNFLTQQVRGEFENLEKQVMARTAELTRRTSQLETAAQVARESAAILDVDQLLSQTTRLISDRFGYYHVGLFLIDDAGEFAILRATNSLGGKNMLGRGHKIKLGQGVVGYAAAKLEPSMVSDTNADETYLKNPDLPQTRSELSLPLKVRDQLIGVLDVQSMEPSAYSEEDIRILQILADQLALAIENARLLTESRRALRELEIRYGQQVRQSWTRRLASRPLSFLYNRLGTVTASPPDFTSNLPAANVKTFNDDPREMQIPIALREQNLGEIILRRDSEQEPWSEDDRRLGQEAAIQIASSLEYARLLDEIQSRALQESTVSQITAKVQQSLDLDNILKTAAQEIGLAINARRVSIRLGNESTSIIDTEESGSSVNSAR